MAGTKKKKDVVSGADVEVIKGELMTTMTGTILSEAVPTASVNITLNNDALVTIVVARTEEAVHKRMRTATTAYNKHKDALNAAEKAMIEAYNALPIDPKLRKQAGAFDDVAGQLGVSFKLKFNKSPSPNTLRGEYTITTSFTATAVAAETRNEVDEDDDSYEFGSASGSFMIVTTCKLPDAIVKQIKQIDAIRRDCDKAMEALKDVRAQHQQIGSIERRTRAKLAEITLAKTHDGQELLSKLTASIEEQLDELVLPRELATR